MIRPQLSCQKPTTFESGDSGATPREAVEDAVAVGEAIEDAVAVGEATEDAVVVGEAAGGAVAVAIGVTDAVVGARGVPVGTGADDPAAGLVGRSHEHNGNASMTRRRRRISSKSPCEVSLR